MINVRYFWCSLVLLLLLHGVGIFYNFYLQQLLLLHSHKLVAAIALRLYVCTYISSSNLLPLLWSNIDELSSGCPTIQLIMFILCGSVEQFALDCAWIVFPYQTRIPLSLCRHHNQPLESKVFVCVIDDNFILFLVRVIYKFHFVNKVFFVFIRFASQSELYFWMILNVF